MTGQYYSPETRARVVRLARLEVKGDNGSRTQSFRDVAKKFGMTGGTVRNWVRQAGRCPQPAAGG